MTRPASWLLCLFLLSIPLVYAVFTGGADDPNTFSVTIFDLGLAGLAGGLLLFRAAPASRPERVINLAALGFLAYVAFQLVPLPLSVLRVLSPTRADIADAVNAFTGGGRFAPLTVAPTTTWLQLSRITGYAVAFFVSRQLVRRSPYGPWTAALPLVAVGAAQAAYGLVTGEGAMELLSGSYPNRNHFAGLLEMTLPFALMYGLSVLYRSGRRGVMAMTDVVQAAVPLALTCLMLVAVLFSSSKSGAVGCALSLFFIISLSLGRGLSRGQRWTFHSVLVLLFLGAVVFVTPANLVERIGTVITGQSSEGRLPVWRDTLHLIAAYPLFGCGLGAFFPAFLRYQIAGAGWAWTNTHNDYLQLLSELGIVGFVAPVVLMSAVFWRAVAEASQPEPRETRFIGLACAGSLLAILVHSVTDFNTYVTANGLVLSWVAGVAATLGPPAADGAPRTTGRIEFGVGPIVLLLGVAVAAYGGAWFSLLRPGTTNAAREQAFCRFGVCSSDTALSALRRQAREAAPDTAGLLPAEVLLPYLTRDPSAPYRWDEFADALFRAGRKDQARTAFARAVELGPTSASTLLMAAEFQFDDGRESAGFELTSRALQAGQLESDPQLYDAAFSMLEAKHVPPAHVPESLRLDKPAALALMRRFLQTDGQNLDAARAVWPWAVERGFVDGPLMRQYLDTLLSKKLEREAWDDWLRYEKAADVRSRRERAHAAQMHEVRTGDGSGGEVGGGEAAGAEAGASVGASGGRYPEDNLVFNGGFEREPSGSPFDWRIQPAAGVKATFDGEARTDGSRSLRLTFDGTQNVADIGVTQRVYLAPGHYTFRAQVRSESLTTDQGVAFRISYDAAPSQLDVWTDAVRGTEGWTALEAEFDAPEPGGIVSIRVLRKASLKFDKLVRGNVLLDSAAITSLAR